MKKILSLTALLIMYSVVVFAEDVELPTFSARPTRKVLYYNMSGFENIRNTYRSRGNVLRDYNWDEAHQFGELMPLTASDFSVSIPVQANDRIEVTFTGEVHGNAFGYIGASALSTIVNTDIANPVITDFPRIPGGYPQTARFYSNQGTGSTIWAPFMVKATFRATGAGNARFVLLLTQRLGWLEDIAANAALNPPLPSPEGYTTAHTIETDVAITKAVDIGQGWAWRDVSINNVLATAEIVTVGS